MPRKLSYFSLFPLVNLVAVAEGIASPSSSGPLPEEFESLVQYLSCIQDKTVQDVSVQYLESA